MKIVLMGPAYPLRGGIAQYLAVLPRGRGRYGCHMTRHPQPTPGNLPACEAL